MSHYIYEPALLSASADSEAENERGDGARAESVFSTPKRAVILLLILLGLRLCALASRGFWFDEVTTIDFASSSLGGVVDAVRRDLHPPLYFVLMHFWLQLVPHSEWWARTPSVLCSVGTVLLFYRLVRRFFADELALCASFLLGISFTSIAMAREARQYALVEFLLVASVYLFLKWREIPTRRRFLALVLVHAELLYTNYTAAFIVFAEACMLLRDRPLVLRWMLGWCLSLLIFLPWLPCVWQQLHSDSLTLWIPEPTLRDLLRMPQELMIGPMPFRWAPLWIVWGLCGGLLGGWMVPRMAHRLQLKPAMNCAAAWFFAPVLALCVISYFGPNLFVLKTVALFCPGLCLLAAALLYKFESALLRSLFCGMLGALIFSRYPPYFAAARHPDWPRVARWLAEHHEEGDVILIDPPHERTTLRYYLPELVTGSLGDASTLAGKRVWYVRTPQGRHIKEAQDLLSQQSYELATKRRYPEIFLGEFVRKR